MSSRLAAHIMTPKGTILPFKPKRAKAVPVEDGHVFNLGGRKVVVLSVPGHTRGSIALIDVMNRVMFTGDDINRSLWMQLPGCTTLREWMDGGRLLLELSRVYAAWEVMRTAGLRLRQCAEPTKWSNWLRSRTIHFRRVRRSTLKKTQRLILSIIRAERIKKAVKSTIIAAVIVRLNERSLFLNKTTS